MVSNGGGEFTGKGFGIEVSAKGALVVLVVLILFMGLALGFLIWEVGKRADRALEASTSRLVSAFTYSADHAAENQRNEHSALARSMEKVACSLFYSPEERKAIRLAIEKNPALKDAWCP